MDVSGKVNSIHYKLKTGMINIGVRCLTVATNYIYQENQINA